MLRRTFLHLYGVGEATERRWWAQGLLDWRDYLAAAEPPGPPAAREENRRRVEECERCWREEAWGRLDRLLPESAHWRAFGDLGAQWLCLDIETDGSPENEITMIGAWDGREYRAFIAGRDLDEALRWMDRHPLWITYNGAQFDLPLIRAHFRNEPTNAFHIDLRYPLRRLGMRGGLKRIEEALGIERPEIVRGLSGWDAVRLWNEYRRGSTEALEVLIAYNREDTRNLETLMRWCWDRLSPAAATPLGAASAGATLVSAVPESAKCDTLAARLEPRL